MFSLVNLKEISFQEKVVCLLVFLCPIFFLTLRGWTNTFYFLLLLISLTALVSDWQRYIGKADKLTWLVFFILATPILVELIAQVGRNEFKISSLDSPSRFLGGAILLLYFARLKINREILFLFCAGAFLGCFMTFGSTLINQEDFWANRAATYFVDPTNLGFNTLLLMICSMCLPLATKASAPLKICFVVAVTLGGYVLFISGARTSWIAFLVAIEVLILFVFRKKISLLALTQISLFILIILAWESSDFARERILELLNEFRNIREHAITSSAQFRLKLFLIDIELIKQSPVFGTADGQLPPFSEIHNGIPWITYEDYNMMVVAGAHSEFMAQFVRKGFVLGFMALVGTVFYPTYFFFKRRWSFCREGRAVAITALMICATLLVSGLAIEFTNLKMNASFLSLFFALSYSYFLSEKEKKVQA